MSYFSHLEKRFLLKNIITERVLSWTVVPGTSVWNTNPTNPDATLMHQKNWNPDVYLPHTFQLLDAHVKKQDQSYTIQKTRDGFLVSLQDADNCVLCSIVDEDLPRAIFKLLKVAVMDTK